MRTMLCVWACAVVLSFAVKSKSIGQEMFAPVYPPHATVHCRSIGEWTAEYWKWAISIPAPENPIVTGENCDAGQSGPVWFVAVSLASGIDEVTRRCTVPAGRDLLLPLASAIFWSPDDCPPGELDQCRVLARGNTDDIFRIDATFDGKPFERIEGHREESPYFTFQPPAENFLGLDPDITYTAVQDGYWVLIPAPPVGIHRAEVQVFYGSPNDPRVGTKVIFEITVAPEVCPADSTIEGKTIEEWSATWWQWVFDLPRSRSPIADATGANCAEAQSGPVWFLAGSISSDPVHRACNIPCGKYIFFPVLNVVAWAPGDCDPTNLDGCRLLAKEFMDQVSSLRIEINGVPIENLQDHRHVSPAFPFRVDCDTIFPLDCKVEYMGVSDGYWFMLKPLPPGSYTLRWRGVWGSEQDPIGAQDITYDFTVEPCRFRRGESDGNGMVNLTDAVATLNYLFAGACPLPCLDAADADDDGKINITDAVFTLLWLFQGGTVPPAPGPDICGEDPTADDLPACSVGC